MVPDLSIDSMISYFGYGSLVNPATHRTKIIDYSKATLKGWRREWLARPNNSFGNVVLLSVKRCEKSEIDGLVVLDHAHNQPALDEREANYDRKTVTVHELAGLKEPYTNQDETSIYVASHHPMLNNAHEFCILRSYLDAVMQGYLHHFGEEGVARFVQSTDNFHFAICEDRHNPRYPRFVETSNSEQKLFDQLAPGS